MEVKKLFVLIFLMIILTGVVSSTEWDNVKSYNEETKTITVTNLLGLGGVIARIQLESPLNYKVPRGEEILVAWYNLENIEDYDGLKVFDIIETLDLRRGNSPIQKNIVFKKKKINTIEIPIYDTTCIGNGEFNINGTEIEECIITQTGTIEKEVEEWEGFNQGNLLDSGNYTIGLFTEVEKNEKVEWIPTMYGIEITEWAVWTEDLNVDLLSFWTLNELSGELKDSLGLHNGTASAGADYGETGIINNAMGFVGVDYINISNYTEDASYQGIEDFTISLWFKPNSLGENQAIFSHRTVGQGGATYPFDLLSTTQLDFAICTGGANDNIATVGRTFVGQWNHITLTYDKSVGNFTIWHNGTSYANSKLRSADSPLTNMDTADWYIGTSGYSPHTRGSTSLMDEIGIWTRILTKSEIDDLYNDGAGISYSDEISINNFFGYLISPKDNTISALQMINFSANQTGIGNINNTNATLMVWNSSHYLVNETSINFALNNGTIFGEWNDTYIPVNGSYVWNVWQCGSNLTTFCNYTYNGNFSIEVGSTPPTLLLNEDVSDLFVEVTSFPQNATINYTATDGNLDTCFVFSSDDDTNITFTCNELQNISFSTGGTKTIFYGANDSYNSITINSTSFDIGTYNASVDLNYTVEGTNSIFNLTINKTGIGLETLNATLIYNNTLFYYDTLSVVSDDFINFGRTITIPEGTGNTTGNLIDWEWNFTTSDSGNSTTAIQQQTVYVIGIDDCSVYGEIILNMTHYDEGDRTFINTTAGSSIEIDLEIISKENSSLNWSYNNEWINNQSVSICIPSGILNTTDYQIDFVTEYSATDHVTEFYYLDNGTLDNSSTFNSFTNKTINLYSLLTTDSTSFLFNFFDEDGLPIEGSLAHVFRQYIGDGIFEEVERSKQDENGDTILHLVEEDVIYYFQVSLDSQWIYTSSTYTALCQAVPCTIQLEESGGFQEFEPTDEWDLIDGGYYSITSSSSTRIINMTYNLENPAKMNLTVYALVSDGSYSPVGSEAKTSTTGSVSVLVPTISGNTTFFATVYQGDIFKKSQYIDFEEDAGLYFGNTLSLFLGALMILTFGLIAVTEGVGVIIFLILGMLIATALGLVDYRATAGYSTLIYLILAGGIIIWKLTRRNR